MFVDFDTLGPDARIWIYQSNRALTDNEINSVSSKLRSFVEEWTRHGDDLRASFDIRYDHFIILAVDENFAQVSGCSIDASTHVFKNFEQEFQVELLNKLNTAFRNGEHINIVSLSDFQRFVKEDKIKPDTLVFNNMVQNKGELEESWEVPANKSWHNRYFN